MNIRTSVITAVLVLAGTVAFAQKTVLQVQDSGGDRAIIEAPTLTGNRTLTIPDYTGTILVTSSSMGTNRAVRTNGLGEIETVALTNGQLLIGSTGNTPQVGSLTGTANQVTVTAGAGTITLSLPQSIATSSNVTFNNLQTLGGLDVGGGTLAGAANTYLYLRAAGASTDQAYMRQIGGSDSYHLTIDIYDNLTGNQFSIRSVQPTTGDTASALNLSDNVLTLGYGAQGSATSIVMNDATTGTSNTGSLTVAALTANRTYTFPDISGTIAVSGSIGIDDLSDAKSGGTNFTNSLVLGHQNLPNISSAEQNTAVGYGTIPNIATGDWNTALGYQALNSVWTGDGNVALGALSMASLTVGHNNVAVGTNAMNGATTSGLNNVAVGHEAGYEIDGSAYENTALGARIFRNQLTGNRNTAVGADAMYNGGTGGNNVVVGYSAMSSITTGANNVVIGSQAGLLMQTGSGNVFIGHNAGWSETGSDKLYIDNTSTATPLIYGDFSSNNLTVNGALTLEAGTSTYGNGVDAGNLSNTYIAFGAAGASNDWSYLRQIGGIDNYHVVWDFHDNADDARFSIRSVTSSGATPDVITTRLSLDGSGNLTVGGIGYFNRASATEGGEIELQTSGNTANVWALDEFSGNNEARFRIFPSSGGDLYGLCIEENDGHVGLGTNNPIVPLHVYRAADSTFFRIENSLTSFGISLADNFNVTNWASGAADYAANITPPVIVLNSPNTTSFVFGDHLGPWSDNDYDLGHSFARWRNIYAGNNVIQTSDYRLKDDLRAFEALPLVRRIPVYDYVWKSSGQRQYGFMAHELQEVVPYLVMGTKDAVDSKGNPVYQGLDYSKLTPILTKAIQEQQAVIESQQQTINDLRSRMERMEQALESLLQEKK